MSRIGKAPIEIPAGVTVEIAKDNVVTVKGPKGTLVQAVNPEFEIKLEDGHLHIIRPSDDREHRAQHGLSRIIRGFLLRSDLASTLISGGSLMKMAWE